MPPAAQPLWYLYLIECVDGSLYTGITTDVKRRYLQHTAGKGARYTRTHKPLRLIGCTPVGSQADALKAELVIKSLPRGKKISALLSHTFTSKPRYERHHTMNKTELVEAIAKESDLTKADAERALSAFVGAIVKAVAKGDTVSLIGFGSFKPSKRAARTGRNPQTGAELKIKATTLPRFSAGATFKAAVAGKKTAKKK